MTLRVHLDWQQAHIARDVLRTLAAEKRQVMTHAGAGVWRRTLEREIRDGFCRLGCDPAEVGRALDGERQAARRYMLRLEQLVAELRTLAAIGGQSEGAVAGALTDPPSTASAHA